MNQKVNLYKNGKTVRAKISKFLQDCDGILISDIGEYKNARTKLKWKCKKGHEFFKDWNHIQRGQWCPYCAGRHITIQQINKIAEDRNGKCISKVYTRCVDKLLWECAVGHQWYASLNSIKNGNSWCPYCTTSVGENICRIYFEYAFSEYFPKMKPVWLVNNNGYNLELDGFCDKLNIGFEYNGPHHYNKVYKNQDLKKVIKHDFIKKKLCKDTGVTLIVIKDKDNVNKKKYIKNYLTEIFNKLNLSYRSFKDYKINDCDIYNYNPLQELYDIANEHGGKCLSDEYNGVHTKYLWQCKNNHTWESELVPIKTRQVWCKRCNDTNAMTINDLLIHITFIRDNESNLFNKRILSRTIIELSKNNK